MGYISKILGVLLFPFLILTVSACKNDKVMLSTIITIEVTDISNRGAMSGGNVTNDGGSPIVSKGVCWNTTGNPTTGDSKTMDGSGTGSYISAIAGLKETSTYYVRAYAINNAGIAYGSTLSFSSLSDELFQPIEQLYPGVNGVPAEIYLGNVIVNCQLINGEYIYQGDIVLEPQISPSTKGAGILDISKRWPENKVYYSIDNNVPNQSRITDAIEEFESKTNLIFIPKINESMYIQFVWDDTSCSSNVGMVSGLWGINHNKIRIPNWAITGNVIHEICHSIGLVHEQSKSGRDNYVTIIWDNIINSAKNNFEEYTSLNTQGFDFGSIMLYPSSAFSKYPKDPTKYTSLKKSDSKPFGANRKTFSSSDITIINQMYPQKPSVLTTSVSNVTQTTASSGGTITYDGGWNIYERGVCWSINQNPTTSDSKTKDGAGIGSFTSNIAGLVSGTTYYLRAYATSDINVGPGYGNQVSFTTLKSDGEPGTFTDSRDGHVYKTVIIGTQTWMAENLAYLPSVSPSSDRSEDSPFYYVYNYQGSNIDGAKTTTNYTTYGALYNWESAKKAYPSDWYLPSDLDWTALTNYLSTSAGGKMKETGLIHWNSPNTGATNESGFSALPGGICSSSFGGLGGTAAFWSSSENGTQNGYCRFLYSYSSSMSRFGENRATGFSIRCLKEPILATVTTANVTAITETSATCGGDIINCGSSTATDRGVCWNYTGAPTISDNKISNGPGPGTGAFTSFITGLIAGAPYYLRAYVTNAFGTTYGEQKEFFTSGTNNSEIIFNPNLTYGTLTDIDGNVYKTIQIGTQIWMAENLKVTHYSNGDQILNVTDNTEWMNSTAGAYCWFHNDINNKTIYGALYNSRARMDSRKIAPTGWHVPTAAEWTSLANYLGGPQIAGGILKETGTSHWHVPNTGATNETGFTGLPGGYRGHEGKFVLISSSGWWGWESISECRGLQYDSGNLSYIIFAESQEFEIVLGFSVRCVKD